MKWLYDQGSPETPTHFTSGEDKTGHVRCGKVLIGIKICVIREPVLGIHPVAGQVQSDLHRDTFQCCSKLLGFKILLIFIIIANIIFVYFFYKKTCKPFQPHALKRVVYQ